mmetsp:Transcript_11517/g.26318  ORF Transcript_11517/g.26318 Transcript_11517/m.26318 type:complete len:720 (-) Transcript_11517:3078-5237(-)
MENSPQVVSPAAVAEVVPVRLLAGKELVILGAVGHDPVPGFAGRVPVQHPHCLVEVLVVRLVVVHPAEHVLRGVDVVEEGESEDGEDGHDEQEQGEDVGHGWEGDEEGLNHLAQADGPSDQTEDAEDAKGPQGRERGDFDLPVGLDEAAPLSVDDVEDEEEDGEGDHDKVEDVPGVDEVPVGSEPDELHEGLEHKDDSEAEVDPKHRRHHAVGLVMRLEGHDQDVEDDRDGHEVLEPGVGRQVEAPVAEAVLRALDARPRLEVVDNSLHLLPLVLLGREERGDPLLVVLDLGVVGDDDADDQVEQHKVADDDLHAGVDAVEHRLVRQWRHAELVDICCRCHHLHPSFGRRHVEQRHGCRPDVVKAEVLGLPYPQPSPSCRHALDDGGNRLGSREWQGGDVDARGLEVGLAVEHLVLRIVAGVCIARVEVDAEDRVGEKPQDHDREDGIHGGDAGDHADYHNLETDVPLDHTQRADGAEGAEGLESLHVAGGPEGSDEGDDHNGKVKPVPGAAKVGELVADETVREDLEGHLQGEDDREDLVQHLKDLQPLLDHAAWRLVWSAARSPYPAEVGIPRVPGAVELIRLPGEHDQAAVESDVRTVAVRPYPRVVWSLEEEGDARDEYAGHDEELEGGMVHQPADEQSQGVLGLEDSQGGVRNDPDKEVDPADVDKLLDRLAGLDEGGSTREAGSREDAVGGAQGGGSLGLLLADEPLDGQGDG